MNYSKWSNLLLAVSGLTFSLLTVNPQRATALDQLEAAQILIWFYGDSAAQQISDAGGMTPEATTQAEEMLNGVLSCSVQMGYVKSVFSKTYKVPTNFVGFVASLGTSVAKEWLISSLGTEQKVYQTCKTSVARSYRGAVLGALEIR